MDEGAANFVAFVLGIVLLLGGIETVSNRFRRHSGWDKRCEKRCEARGQVHARDNGLCTCRDGTVWVWQEGYTHRLGGAAK